jgi:hypothetical protein
LKIHYVLGWGGVLRVKTRDLDAESGEAPYIRRDDKVMACGARKQADIT